MVWNDHQKVIFHEQISNLRASKGSPRLNSNTAQRKLVVLKSEAVTITFVAKLNTVLYNPHYLLPQRREFESECPFHL